MAGGGYELVGVEGLREGLEVPLLGGRKFAFGLVDEEHGLCQLEDVRVDGQPIVVTKGLNESRHEIAGRRHGLESLPDGEFDYGLEIRSDAVRVGGEGEGEAMTGISVWRGEAITGISV